MRRLKVWVVTPELHRQGGTERCLAEQVERWRTRFDLRFYTMRVEGVDLVGVGVRHIPWLPGPHLVRYLWWFAANTVVRAWDAWRQGRPDVEYSPGINCPDATAMSVHIVFGKYWDRVRTGLTRDLFSFRRAVGTVHRSVYWGLLRTLERFIYSGPATIWGISRKDARMLETRFGRPSGSVQTIPHGVDVRQFSPGARLQRRSEARATLGVNGSRVLLLISNDVRNKGADTAIRALSLLPDDVMLAVAGRVDTSLVRAWALESGVADRVGLWAHTPDVLNYYAAADVLLAPSREDAFHLPALEALACGLPTVVSAKAGISELVEDGCHALVLRGPEDPTECARLVRRILENPALAEGLAQQGRALAEQYSWDANAEKTADLIEREATTPRVLVLAPHAWGTGGIERTTRTMLKTLADLYGPERVGLLSIWGGEAQLPCRTLWRGPRSAGTVPVPLSVKFRFAFAAAVAARRWRNRLIIMTCHPHLAPVARICSWLSGAPYLVWCYGREVWEPLRAHVRWSLCSAEMVVVPSRFTASMLRQTSGIADGQLEVVPLALSPEMAFQSTPRSLQKPKVLSVSRLMPEHAYKGVDMLIAAWPHVLDAIPEAQLLIVGDGPDRNRLESAASRLVLDGRVRFCGRLDDGELEKAYAEATLFALPVRTTVGRGAGGEGFGLAFLEAAAAGLPVVAGNGGAIPEVVRDGETGLLVNPEAPDEVGAAIVRLLRNPDLAQRMGEAAKRRALEEFSYDRFRQRLGELIEQVQRTS